MEKTKTTQTKKSNEGLGWAGFLLENIFKSIQSSFNRVVGKTRQAALSLVDKIMERMFLFLFAFLGAVLLLVGLSQLASTVYQVPGSGEIMIGIFILTAVFIIYMFIRKDNQK